MENATDVLAGVIPAAGSLDRAPVETWTMTTPRSPQSAARQLAPAGEPIAEKGRDKTVTTGFTLRVKPDRRRQQLPIPPERDRRTSR